MTPLIKRVTMAAVLAITALPAVLFAGVAQADPLLQCGVMDCLTELRRQGQQRPGRGLFSCPR